MVVDIASPHKLFGEMGSNTLRTTFDLYSDHGCNDFFRAVKSWRTRKHFELTTSALALADFNALRALGFSSLQRLFFSSLYSSRARCIVGSSGFS